MASVNKCIFIGRLGRYPELKYMPSGDAMCSMSIAVSEKWKDKTTNEQKEKVEWINLQFFGKLAEIAGKYLTKGSEVYVEGKMQTQKYTDKAGVEKYSTSVKVDQLQMLGGGNKETESTADNPPASRAPAARNNDPDDSIPF